MQINQGSKSKGDKRPSKSKDAETPTVPTGTAETPETPTVPTGTAETPEEQKAPEPEKAPEPDPLTVLRTKRAAAEASIAETMAEVNALSAKGDIAGVMSAMQGLSTLQAEIASLAKEIAATGFAQRLNDAIKVFVATIAKDEIPSGEMDQFVVVFRQGAFDSVRPHVSISGRTPKASAPIKQAALTSDSTKEREPRLPPSGLTLPSQGGEGRGPCMVTYTQGAGVMVSGPCQDGTVLSNEPFTSVSTAGTRVTGSSVNGYTWAQLGPKGHSWCGVQVDRLAKPIK